MKLLEGGNELALTVECTLHALRIPGSLQGMRFLMYAIERTVKDPTYTQFITKRLYIDIALFCHSTPSRVERSMRTAVEVSWNNARKELNQMAGYHLVKRPTNREFIDLVAFYIRHRC